MKRVPSDGMSWGRLSDSAHRVYVRLKRVFPAFPHQRRAGGVGGTETRYRARLDSGFDFEGLEAALRWLPGLEQATSPMERAYWIALHEQLLGVSLSMMPPTDKLNVQVHGTPHTFEHRLHDRLCHLVLQLQHEEDHSRLWAPILDLGAPASYWVTGFLDRWFLAGPMAAPTSARFFQRWKDLIEYASRSAAWKLFQEKWAKAAMENTGSMQRWVGLQRQRLLCLLKWQRETVEGSMMSPWIALKREKPEARMFLPS